jgi:hypothetical protein
VKTSSSDIPFEVLPWTKVRVDLLSEPSNFLHRLKKHLRSIRKGKKRLTRTQLRFISECFEEQPPSHVTLEEYNRISTIAACLASWIYLCVYYCYFDSHVPRDQQYLEATQEKILIQAEEEKPINSSFIGHYRQMRFSIKHKGQFYLFRVRCDPLQLRIGYLRLDSRCIESSMDTKQSLKPLDSSHLLLPTGIEPIDVFQLPTISFKSIVLQMIHYSTLLELSRKKLLNGQKSLSPSEDAKRQFPLLLKYIAINKSKVVGIGSATVNGKITLKEFRPIITDHLKSVMNSEEETFAFILQGAIISIYLERNYRLPALLPVALLYIHSIDKRSKPKSDLKIASQIPNLLSFHCRIACGVNTVLYSSRICDEVYLFHLLILYGR